MEKKIYMKPSTEVFFVENPQLMETTNDGQHNPAEPNPGGPIVEEAKGFDLWENAEDSEALYGNPSIWDE